MTREEMLKELSKIDYLELWPSDDWDDVGFTERRIWLNNSGYGYIACDEPDIYYKITRLPDQKWRMIREKIIARRLEHEDIQETVLSKLDLNMSEDLNEDLKGLLLLPDSIGEYFYCAVMFDENLFFNTEMELLESIKRTDCDVYWSDLSDDELQEWVNRLELICPGLDSFCDLIVG